IRRFLQLKTVNLFQDGSPSFAISPPRQMMIYKTMPWKAVSTGIFRALPEQRLFTGVLIKPVVARRF
ncbi:MAG: hypothetical protein WCL27_15025, partial [Betaproteobacteria bacterium]